MDRPQPLAAAPPLLDRPAAVRALLVVGVTAVSFAAILIRVAQAPVLALALWRCVGGSVALAPAAGRARVWPGPGDRARLLCSGALLAVHFALFIGSLSLTTVASAVVFVATAPLFVGVGAAVFLREPPTGRTWTGMGLGVLGTIVIGVADATGGPAVSGTALLGDAMAFGAAIAVAGYLLLGQATRRRLPVSTYGLWVYGVAAVVLALAVTATGTPMTGFDTGTWLAIAGLIVGPQLLGHTVFNQVLNVVPATTVAVVVLSEPIGAGVLAYLVFGEVPPPLFALGAPFLLAGVYLAATGQTRGRVEPPIE